jgi:positive regulator of sigma E activity
MITRKAQVIAMENGIVRLQYVRSTACDCCGGGCTDTCRTLNVETDISLKLNDEVEVGLEASRLLLVSFLTFFVPCVLFVGILAVMNAGVKGVFAASTGAGIYMLIYKFCILKRMEPALKPRIVKVL